MPEHSPEPWHVVDKSLIGSKTIVDDADRHMVAWASATPTSPNQTIERAEANIRRIVACVNFCARIPTETIERLLEQKVGAATALKMFREWAEDDDECPSCSRLYDYHDDDCLLKPLVDAAKEIE